MFLYAAIFRSSTAVGPASISSDSLGIDRKTIDRVSTIYDRKNQILVDMRQLSIFSN